MRVVQNEQMTVGEVDISKMKFDLKSRDDVPKILRGLQHLYMDVAQEEWKKNSSKRSRTPAKTGKANPSG